MLLSGGLSVGMEGGIFFRYEEMLEDFMGANDTQPDQYGSEPTAGCPESSDPGWSWRLFSFGNIEC